MAAAGNGLKMRCVRRARNGVAVTGSGVLLDRSWMATDKAGVERGTDTESEAEDENQDAQRTAHELDSTADARATHLKRVHGDTLAHATVDPC